MAQELNVVDVYNDLHQIPELGFQEFKTSAYIAEKLKQMGYEVTTGVGKTGVVAVEKGSRLTVKTKLFMLADMTLTAPCFWPLLLVCKERLSAAH